MIHWFEVENLFSFAKPTRIDFTAGKKADDHSVAISQSGARLNKLTAVYGANAAGKSNLVFAIARLADFAANSFNWSTQRPLPFRPHFFSKGEPVRLAVQFEVPAQRDHSAELYRYELFCGDGKVLGESLAVKRTRQFARVFERIAKDGDDDVAGLGQRYRDVPEKVSFISWLARHEVPEAKRVADYFGRFRSNDVHGLGRFPPLVSLDSAARMFRENALAHARMVQLLCESDIGVSNVEYEAVTEINAEGVERERLDTFGVHRRGDQTARLRFGQESSGTQAMFAHLSRILPVLTDGGVAVVDEIEADLHPALIKKLMDLFRFPETNPHKAQLVFTTHSPAIMDTLNRWSVVLVEKVDGDSTAWRLSDMTGVQGRDNHAARYLAGAYGGVPRDLDVEDDCLAEQ